MNNGHFHNFLVQHTEQEMPRSYQTDFLRALEWLVYSRNAHQLDSCMTILEETIFPKLRAIEQISSVEMGKNIKEYIAVYF